MKNLKNGKIEKSVFQKIEKNKIWVKKSIFYMSEQEKKDLLSYLWNNGHIYVSH